MNQSIVILFIFMIGIIIGYSFHESKDKIEIHGEANKIFTEYQNNKIKDFNMSITCTNISGIDIPWKK